jgi:hypothetical protein
MGKERVAHTIHCNNGDRKDNLFIARRCPRGYWRVNYLDMRKVLFRIDKSETRPV